MNPGLTLTQTLMSSSMGARGWVSIANCMQSDNEAAQIGYMYRSLLGSVLQEALDVMTKEKARLRADMEFLQRQLDLVAQQADQVQTDAETRPAGQASEVSCRLLMPLLWY